jgi:hypothetical protein
LKAEGLVKDTRWLDTIPWETLDSTNEGKKLQSEHHEEAASINVEQTRLWSIPQAWLPAGAYL